MAHCRENTKDDQPHHRHGHGGWVVTRSWRLDWLRTNGGFSIFDNLNRFPLTQARWRDGVSVVRWYRTTTWLQLVNKFKMRGQQ